MNGKKYNVPVSYEISRDIPNVRPPFVKGERTSSWITSPTRRKADILKIAKHLVEKAYGLELLNPEIIHGMAFWH